MKSPEAECRVEEFSALVECQRRLIKQLERGGNDVTSAKIIFDSLRVSLSLYIHDRHRVRCYVEPEQPELVLAAQAPATFTSNYELVQPKISGSAWDAKPVFGVVHRVALRGGETPVPKNDLWKVIKERLAETAVVPDESVQEKTGDQPGRFEFRPLTEEEKNEFMNSLDAKGKRIVAELMGKECSSESDAA
jgi:hypothetical protein